MPRRRPETPLPAGLADVFHHSLYQAALGPTQTLPLDIDKSAIRRQLRERCSDGPGVYGLVNDQAEVIYAGMSRALLRRLISYFPTARARRKEVRLGRTARTLFWQPAAHELIAWLRERELIRRFRPLRNVQGQPTRSQLGYLILTDDSAANFDFRSTIPKQHAGAWGPLPATSWTRSAVTELNFHFQLRDCPRDTPMAFTDAAPPLSPPPVGIPCIRHELQTCLAPCIGGCSVKQYSRRVSEAKRFLSGRTQAPLEALRERMGAAAQARQFELAARCRDRLNALERLDRHLRRFHDWRVEATFVYRLRDARSGARLWLAAARGTVVALAPRPGTKVECEHWLSLLGETQRRLQGSARKAVAGSPEEFEAARLLYRWFRRHPEEQRRRCSLAKVIRVCQSMTTRAANADEPPG